MKPKNHKLTLWRKFYGIKQKWLAATCGVSTVQFWNIENWIYYPKIDLVIKLCDLLPGLQPKDFIEHEVEQKGEKNENLGK
jgi:DNA-binding XRE family transcriptional regulator